MSEYEDEIESLNSNLDAKNDFIVALEQSIDEKNKESQFLVMQMEKSREVIKDQDEEINSIRRRPQTGSKKVIYQKTQEDIETFC